MFGWQVLSFVLCLPLASKTKERSWEVLPKLFQLLYETDILNHACIFGMFLPKDSCCNQPGAELFLVRKLCTIHSQCYDLAFVEMHAWKKFFVSNLFWEWNQLCGNVVVSEAPYFPPWTLIFYLFSYETPWTLMYQYRPVFRLVLGSFRNCSFFLQRCDEALYIWNLMLTTKSWFFFFLNVLRSLSRQYFSVE